MIYILITTSIYNNDTIRLDQYKTGISTIINKIKDCDNYTIIIIENNNNRGFLEQFNQKIFYTNNNTIPTTNKGHKELIDIHQCIERYNILDSDFIIKITGRYIIDNNCPFFDVFLSYNYNLYDAVLKYGSYLDINSKSYVDDCITGLIGLKCKFVKQIKIPTTECVEWNWAKTINSIDKEKICCLNKLGINICPGSNNYFLV